MGNRNIKGSEVRSPVEDCLWTRNENMVILEGGRHKAGFRRRPVYGKDGKWRKEFHV